MQDMIKYNGEMIPEFEECEDCGYDMHWCTMCEQYSKSCCVMYGTCWCN